MVMAMRTRSPVVPVTWHDDRGTYRLCIHQPMDFSQRGDRQRRAAAGMREFAGITDHCLRTHPDMWWNWGDKRWTGIIRNHGR
jgi:lauroyl/myristoyl acyltransferase